MFNIWKQHEKQDIDLETNTVLKNHQGLLLADALNTDVQGDGNGNANIIYTKYKQKLTGKNSHHIYTVKSSYSTERYLISI